MDNSPFFKLSAEIRNTIYELALAQDKPLIITARDYNSKLHTTYRSARLRPLALTAVCRQIRYESLQLFYAVNTFRVEFPKSLTYDSRDEACLLQRFIASIDQTSAGALRNVIVPIHCSGIVLDAFESADYIRHQLLALRQISLALPQCHIVYDLCWNHLTTQNLDELDVFLPSDGFDMQNGGEGFFEAVENLRKYLTAPSFPSWTFQNHHRFVRMLEILLRDGTLDQQQSVWECGWFEPHPQFPVASRYSRTT